jgi:Ras-related protein Rab-6A
MSHNLTSEANSSTSSKFKIVFLGDQSVGKTSIINRFIYDTFEDVYQATIGIDFLSKPVYVDDKTIRLQLWDTAGQERFKSLIPSYVKDSSVAVICYDITNADTFNSVKTWVENAKSMRGEEVILFIAGNKSDLAEQRAVSDEDGEKLASELGATFYETSAKSGENVKALFDDLAKKLIGNDGDNTDEIRKKGLKLKDVPIDDGAQNDPNASGNGGEGGKQKKKGCC